MKRVFAVLALIALLATGCNTGGQPGDTAQDPKPPIGASQEK